MAPPTPDNRILGDPGSSAFEVGKYPFFQLNRLVSRYNGVIEARLRRLDLDIPRWRVLMILGERRPRGVAEIAEAAVIPVSTMTRIVQRMEAAGLVRAQVAAADARVTEVSLTDLGEARLAAARAATSPVYRRVIGTLSAREFDRLLAMLEALYDNLGDS